MNSRWINLASLSLVLFAGLVIAWQFVHRDGSGFGNYGPLVSVVQSYSRGEKLAKISNIVDRDMIGFARFGRFLDLTLPMDARIFMMDMNGPTNYEKIGYYFYITYYVFPRDVGVCVDQPIRQTENGFPGRTAESDDELLGLGYNVRLNVAPDGSSEVTPLYEMPTRNAANPEWFNSRFDLITAFLLPLLTTLAGMGLFRFLFLTLSRQMPLLEQLAYGLGLGMMGVAALTLGVKLCGFPGRGLILLVTGAGSIMELWRNGKAYLTGLSSGGRDLIRRPVAIIILAAGALVFLLLFWLAGLQGFVDADATRWMLKAKIIHLDTGNKLVQWFSNARLAHAHLDYPTLVPSLHAATYDSLGHVDEFVTRFWPTWMLLFLLGALAALTRGRSSRFQAPLFALLGLLLMPTVQMYVQWEGATMPMIFFMVLGFVQCGYWLAGKDRARLGLGLTMLFGAAMAKLEGFIFMTLVAAWLILIPSARPALKLSLRGWCVLGFWFLAVLPFICLRVQIPALEYETNWVGYALHSPGTTLWNWPGVFMVQLARTFLSSDLANWNAESGRFHWIGSWDGLSSLYNHTTLGLPWFCLVLSTILWFAVPARRLIIIWMLATLIGALAVFSLIFASFIGIKGLAQAINYTDDVAAGRY